MIDYNSIICKYYKEENALRHLLLVHSKAVAQKALAISIKHPDWHLDNDFIFEASMLHDIGIIFTDAPGIYCSGNEPYIRHGVIGASMLRAEGLPRHARVCERHTGTGLTRDDIVSQHLPLPEQDFLPETLEEQIICYADKFFSKSHIEEEKTIEQAVKSLRKFGDECVKRFTQWVELFE